MIVNVDFSKRFTSDTDVEEELDSIISLIGSRIINEENEPQVDNPVRVKQLEFTYNVLKYMTKGYGVKVTYDLHKPFKSMGYVSVTGRDITFTNTEWFTKISEYASNVEIFTKTNGTVQIDFCFHGITSRV